MEGRRDTPAPTRGASIFTVKIVTGGTYPSTEYNEEKTRTAETLHAAVQAAFDLTGTKDILQDGERIARVHTDGGIDYLPARG